jgi:hypothetical protein
VQDSAATVAFESSKGPGADRRIPKTKSSAKSCAILCHDIMTLRKFDGKEWPIDDDGQAIFWREDRFDIIGDPAFWPEIWGQQPSYPLVI